MQRRNLTPESLVDRYGVKTPGSVEYDEFYEIYKNHVHFANEDTAMRPMPKDEIMRGLFNTMDPDQRQKISRKDFGRMIKSRAPVSSFIDRLRKKLLRGKERLMRVLTEESQDIDRMFGASGCLPLATF